MKSKNNLKILTQILNIEGVKVISHSQYQGVGIILQIESLKNYCICPRCGIKSLLITPKS
jgi:hypothetical protein